MIYRASLFILLFCSLLSQVDAQAVVNDNGNGSIAITSTKTIKVRIRGTITDAKTGESLPGASVYLADEKIGTAADAHGHYEFTVCIPVETIFIPRNISM